MTIIGAPANIGRPGMTFLPIVERELRVAARRRGTYGTRLKIASLATLAFAVCYVASVLDPSTSFVKTLFWGLSGLSMIYCLAAGRLMTADCLSREKREGTLGLLFLTDLKGYDVVLGKLAATSLDGFYGLLAVFPIMALPLMAGGMTSGEFWRMLLVLVNTFVFSLAIGLFVSAVSRDERKAMGGNFALLLFLAAVPTAIGGFLASFIPRFAAEHELFYSCPAYSFWLCADKNYKLFPQDFWWSSGLTFGLTLLLALLACRTAPRAWQDKSLSPRALRRKGERRRRWWREGRTEKAGAFRKRALDRNAYFWLAARPYLKISQVWTGLLLIGCCWAFTDWMSGNFEEETSVVFALLLNLMLKLWITTEAGRQLAEDKKSGAFELLLSTPLTVRDIMRGQRLALRRQFLLPVIVAVILELVLTFSIRHREDAAMIRCLWLAGILMLVADALTLGWAGMWAALTAKSFGRATVKTAATILVLPWLLYGAAIVTSYVCMFFFCRQMRELSWQYNLGCWFGAGILVDLYHGLRARRRLQKSFRQLALTPYAPKRWFAWLRDLFTGSPERKAELRAKYRRLAVAAAVVLAVGAGLALYDMHVVRANPPKPVIVSISRSNHPVRVIGGQNGFLFILPDGSLWRWGNPTGQEENIISPPRQIGTDRNWVQVSGTFGSMAGLRSNGTIWTWASDRDPPKQFGSDHDWAEVCAGNGYAFGLKQDGTLWGWGNNNQNQLGLGPGTNLPVAKNPLRYGANAPGNSPGLHFPDAVRVGTNQNWKAVSIIDYGAGALGLRADGTLWIWGNLNYVTNGAWSATNYPAPIQLCGESNWVALTGINEIRARNQAGEWWSLNYLTGAPGAGVPITAISRLLSSNAVTLAYGPLYTTNWDYAEYELRTNGTLWAAPGNPWNWQASAAPLGPPLHFGQRTDWVSVWGSYQTTLGMTSDGTLWTWGLDYGQDSHWVQVFGERFDLIKRIIGSLFGAGQQSNYNLDYAMDQYPLQREPRPLIRLAATNSAGGQFSSPNLNPPR